MMKMLDTDELARYVATQIRRSMDGLDDGTATRMRTIAVLVPTMQLWETVAEEALLQLEPKHTERIERRQYNIRLPYYGLDILPIPFSVGSVSMRLRGYDDIEIVAHPMINDVRMTFGEATRIHETLSVLHLTSSPDLR